MRRTKGRNGPASGGGAAVLPTQPLSFSIPLKDTSKPVAFPANFRKHIALEFAMRYLCQIGATPTVENCRAVLKEMPLEACSVTAAWRSRGCLADAIIIQPGGHRNGGGAGGGMGEAPPSPAGESPLLDVSLGKSGGGDVPELHDQGGAKGATTNRHSRSGSGGNGRNGLHPSPAHANTKRKTTAMTQPASSMGRASPHKVSIFVDAVSSAVGPAIAESSIESTGKRHAGGLGGQGAAAAVAAFQSPVATTARDRNNRRRQNDCPAARSAGTSGRGAFLASRNVRERDQQQRRPQAGGFGHGAFENKRGGSERNEGGGDCDDTGDEYDLDEAMLWDAVELAEARRKMLDPPKVDMAAIATIQAAFARNFPFQKHGEKFADVSVRSSLKDLIMSEGPGRLIGLLSHYLYWIMLLPFSLAHKDRDDHLLLETDYRWSRRQQTARVKLGETRGRSTRAIVSSNTTAESSPSMMKPSVPTSSTTTARGQGGCETADNGASGYTTDEKSERGCKKREVPRQPPPLLQRESGESTTTTATSARFTIPPGDAGGEQLRRPQLTKDEAESLFVSVVEVWTQLRSSLGPSRRARLVQLPIAVAAVRNGVQTVLCNCYPFLETKGGGEGKRLLASLHEEVTARFIPRFYYEGPFTPVAEEEAKQGVENQPVFPTAAQVHQPPTAPAAAPGTQLIGTPGKSSQSHRPSQPSMSSPAVKKKKNFLETSATLQEARRQARAEPWSAGTAAALDERPSTTVAGELWAAGETPHVVGGSRAKRFARDRPGGTRRTGEALFATSTTLGYVFPNPCSPEARKMIASRARARSSQDASRTTSSPSAGMGHGLAVAKSPPWSPSRPARNKTGGQTPSPPSRGASTPGTRSRPLWAVSGEGGDARSSSPTYDATRCVATADSASRLHAAGTRNAANRSRCKGTIDESRRYTHGEPDISAMTHPQQQQSGEEQQRHRTAVSRDPSGRDAAPVSSPSNVGKSARFHDHSAKGFDGNSTWAYDGAECGGAEDRNSDEDDGNLQKKAGSGPGCGGGIDVRVSVGVAGGGVGAAAKAKLYRGYCEQRGEDYDREYRRHGGKEALERLALLNDTFR